MKPLLEDLGPVLTGLVVDEGDLALMELGITNQMAFVGVVVEKDSVQVGFVCIKY